ncbi:TetR/AcrR family transcriptional regulator [Trinickia sp. LjRoot230]|uniref:TetR/AcrR family transcriptional regulator n=1 Tax=Trinickia sp. LjRoot230 TaxID=3342288 RepID=UPI003ECD3831
MLTILSVIALFLVAVTMGLSLAHALEFPGKLRLDEPTCRAVQAIYYPGFTTGGLIGEFGGMVALAALIAMTPTTIERFWWSAAAFGFVLIGHATYWMVTHPINAAWLKDTNLTGMSKMFFGMFSAPDADWKHMRNIWEYSHVARAGLHILAFLSMTLVLIRWRRTDVPSARKPGNRDAAPSPRKPRDLTRQKVVDAALALIDKSGADAISMWSLADALHVTPMALYNHFSSKLRPPFSRCGHRHKHCQIRWGTGRLA